MGGKGGGKGHFKTSWGHTRCHHCLQRLEKTTNGMRKSKRIHTGGLAKKGGRPCPSKAAAPWMKHGTSRRGRRNLFHDGKRQDRINGPKGGNEGRRRGYATYFTTAAQTQQSFQKLKGELGGSHTGMNA